MYRLLLLGGASLDGPTGPVTGRSAQRRRLALLAVLALARGRPVSRDRITALFWPEADTDGARHLLRDTLYVLRSALGDVILTVGDDLRLDDTRLTSDVGRFEAALDAGQLVDAVGLYAGPLLDGVHVAGADGFERWAEGERARLAERHAAALERLATRAGADGDPGAAVGWWRRLAATDPLNTRAALGLAGVLADSGDPAGALQHLHAHTALLAREFGVPPSPSVVALVEQLRRPAERPPSPPVAADAPRRAPDTSDASPPVRVAADPNGEGSPSEAPAGAPAGATGATVSPPPRRRQFRRPVALLGGLAALLLLGVGGASAWRTRDAAAVLDPHAVAVLPFRVRAADTSLRYLREGMLGLLGAKLVGTTHIVGAGVVRQALAGNADAVDDLAPDGVRDLARRVGAARVIVGDVVGGARGQVTLSATLLDAAGGGAPPRAATVAGPADSVPTLVDRLAAHLLVLDADQRDDRIAALSQTPLPALRAFLEGQAAIRQGLFDRACERYAEALRVDSTFALAGVELAYASAGCVANFPNARMLGQRVAWRGRERLSPRDRAVLDAYVGPRYPQIPTPAELVAGGERAVQLAPDNPAAWVFLADAYFALGPLLGIPDAHERARRAFARGLAVDSNFIPFAGFAIAVHAAHGDTTAARRIAALGLPLEPRSEPGYSQLWIAGTALGDSALVRRWRALATPTRTDLGNVVDWAIEAGGSLADAEYAAALHRAGAASDRDRFDAWQDEHLLSLARGQPARLVHAYATLFPVPAELPPGRTMSRWAGATAAQWAVLDALFDCGDPALAARARRALDGALGDSLTMPVGLTVAALYDVMHGDPRAADGAIPLLRRLQVADSDNRLRVARLALLLDAPLAAASGRADAPAALARLDSALRDPPMAMASDEIFGPVGNLVAARLWERSGDVPRALAAVRRRLFFQRRAYFFGAVLRQEGRLATLAGDRAGAVVAYRRYLRLRGDAEPSVRTEVASVRGALADLERSQR